jgi:anti-sigma factor RsiW
LPPQQEAVMRSHLNACEPCRLDWERLSRALAEVRRQCAPSAPGLFPAVLAGIRRWEGETSQPEKGGTAVKRRVEAQIEPFLGQQAAARLLESVPDDGSNLLSTIEPVLANFLGSRAASELVGHVVEAAIMRI